MAENMPGVNTTDADNEAETNPRQAGITQALDGGVIQAASVDSMRLRMFDRPFQNTILVNQPVSTNGVALTGYENAQLASALRAAQKPETTPAAPVGQPKHNISPPPAIKLTQDLLNQETQGLVASSGAHFNYGAQVFNISFESPEGNAPSVYRIDGGNVHFKGDEAGYINKLKSLGFSAAQARASLEAGGLDVADQLSAGGLRKAKLTMQQRQPVAAPPPGTPAPPVGQVTAEPLPPPTAQADNNQPLYSADGQQLNNGQQQEIYPPGYSPNLAKAEGNPAGHFIPPEGYRPGQPLPPPPADTYRPDGGSNYGLPPGMANRPTWPGLTGAQQHTLQSNGWNWVPEQQNNNGGPLFYSRPSYGVNQGAPFGIIGWVSSQVSEFASAFSAPFSGYTGTTGYYGNLNMGLGTPYGFGGGGQNINFGGSGSTRVGGWSAGAYAHGNVNYGLSGGGGLFKFGHH